MGKYSRQVEYFVTSLILFGAGMIFFFMNGSIGTYTALRFSLLQILESLAVFVTGILLTYQAYLESRQENTVDSGENGAENTKAGQEIKEAAESVNATVALLLVAVLVVGYYLFSLKPPQNGTGISPLHLVVCVVTYITYACVERWWVMQIKTDPDAVSVCNLMVINKIATAVLLADLICSYSGVAQIGKYANYAILALWLYTAVMILCSVAIKFLRHGREQGFRLYILFPVYSADGRSGAVAWLEENTGISMRSLWSIDFIRKMLPASLLAIILIVWLSTCLVQVETYERGALYRFGRLSREDILEPGIHFKLPVPFETVKVYNVAQSRWMIIGYEGDVNNKNNLWTRPHEGEEQTLLLGGGKELVAINLKVTYHISDLYQYLTGYASPESILNAKGYEVVMNETISTDIDTLISGDRSVISHEIEDRLRRYAQDTGLGLEVTSVNLASIHPPVAIANVYQEVVNARIQKGTLILTAEGDALAAREGARADRQIAVNDAGISYKNRISAARAEIEEYNASIEAFEMNRNAYFLEKYLETAEKALKDKRKYLVDPEVNVSSLFFNSNGDMLKGQTFGDIGAGQSSVKGDGT